MFQIKFVEKIKTHVLCSLTFFFENRVVYGIMWKNVVQPNKTQMTVRRMRIACWTTKGYKFTLRIWLHERATLLRTLPVLLYSVMLRYAIRTHVFSLSADVNCNVKCVFSGLEAY